MFRNKRTPIRIAEITDIKREIYWIRVQI